MKALKNMERGRRGFVLLYYALSMMVILPIVGLAVDLGMLYNVRAKLTAAVDGASLAAGRCMGSGTTFNDAQPVAIATARKFFWANFPQNYWGSTVRSGDPQVSVTSTDNQIKVTISAGVQSPLTFMRIMGVPTSNVSTGAVAVRRDVNLVLVLDRSGSIQQAGAGPLVKSSSISFVNRMIENEDTVGLVSFSGFVHNHFSPKLVFKDDAASAINGLAFSGNTNSSAALSEAYLMIQGMNKPGALNVIVFFTDGRPTALTASLPKSTVNGESRYGLSTRNNDDSDTVRSYNVSTCGSSPIAAFISAPASGWPPPQTGTTWALGKAWWTKSTDDDDTFADGLGSNGNAAGCLAKTGGTAYRIGTGNINTTQSTVDGRADVAYVPDTDYYGNGLKTGYQGYYAFTSGSYSGKIRPDSPRGVRLATYNAVDNCAARIRSDTYLNPVIFTIGLGGTSGAESIDDVLLERLANDPRSPIYDSERPVGLYALANNASELTDAYDRVASQILRLAQ